MWAIYRWVAVAVAAAVCGCGGGDDFEYPLDDTLRLHHATSRGTHNSYHVAPPNVDVDEWRYTHAPLGEQLGAQGMRQFELDINYRVFEDRFEVFHFIAADEETTCRLLVDCLRDLKRWSDDNPGHLPFVVMIEPKDTFEAQFADNYFAVLERELLSVWPLDRLVTPDLVRGASPDLRTAVAERGWPLLSEVRGKAVFFLLDEGEHRTFYTGGDSSLAGKPLFFSAGLDMPYAAIRKLDNPIADGAAITESVSAGLLVRTRVDRLEATGPVMDTTLRDAALSSGAHFLSTDDTSWTLDGGAPVICNSVTSPAECTATALEDPAFVD